MGVLFYTLFSVLALGWIHRYVKVRQISQPEYFLYPSQEQIVGNPPQVSIIVPARNEQANIEKCIRSLTSQDYRNIEIFVLNDRSTDNTAGIVAQIAKNDQRVHLINIDHCPDGWSGKNHALAHGVKQITGKYIVFTDADTYHYPHCIRSIVSYMQKNKVDLLSVNPHLVTKSFWENVIMPVAGGVLMIWYPLEKVNHCAYHHGYANGQLMVFEAGSYHKIGGHEMVKEELLEDLAFARRIKQAGLRLKVLWGPDIYQTHMYSSLRQIWNGWVRIFSHGFQKHLLRVVGSLFLMVFFSFLPYVLIAYGVFFSGNPVQVALALGLYGWMLYVIARAYRVAKSNQRYIVTHALGCAMVSIILLHTAYAIIARQKINWRGCHYPA